MGKNNEQLLKIAQKHLGEGGAKFRKFCGLPAGSAWCNAFVDYIANEGGDAQLYFNSKKETYCPHSIKWCQANLAQIPQYLALPMDIIYFDWDRNGVPNHIGFVRSKKSTDTILTIEGNTGNAVRQKTRPAKYVLSVFRPHFVPANVSKKKLEIDGDFGYNSIYNLQVALGMKPTGILTKETVKYLQRKAGATPDGQWGPATSKKVQKMIGAKQDGAFGPASVRKLQEWINKVNYQTSEKKPAETKPAPQPAAKPVQTKPATTKKGYTGDFPGPQTNAKIVNGLAFRMCWPYGTKKAKYRYKTGKPTAAYKSGINKAYPKHKDWPNKKQKVGACCDVFTGTCLGLVGIHVPKDLKNQLTEMPKNKSLKSNGHYKAADFKAGDVVQRGRKDKSGHTFVICQLVNGQKYIANAHYKHLGGCYAVMDSKVKTQTPKKWKYYKCYTVLGSVRDYYQKGDYGTDVLRIQKFLNWYGLKCSADGDFGAKTETQIKAFQKAQGLKQDGHVGPTTIAKMKAVKK